MSVTTDGVERVDDARSRPVRAGHRVPGEAGAWIFIFGEMVVFTFLFVLYLVPRLGQPDLFRESQGELNVAIGAVNTLVLLVSSILVVAGVQAVRSRNSVLAPRLFAGALLCGLAFAVIKYFEYSEHLQSGLTFDTNEFWRYYYILTGTHLLHLVIGLVPLTYAIVVSRRGRFTSEQSAFVVSGACYWHMVDFIWLILFPLLYLAT